MKNYILSEINIYPVKSLGGFSVEFAEVTDRGLKHDRRWMLVDENGKFLTQRKDPQMALIQVGVTPNGLQFRHKLIKEQLNIAFDDFTSAELDVIVGEDAVKAAPYEKQVNNWFSNLLGFNCRLVYMKDEMRRQVDKKYAINNEITSFAGGYPFIIVGQSSLEDLNSRLEVKMPMNRFRPNFVFTGGEPYEEDEWKKFKISDVTFFGVKRCNRCALVNVNQETAEKGEEPLRTLSKYRTIDNEVRFGMKLLHNGFGFVNVGDNIEVIERK